MEILSQFKGMGIFFEFFLKSSLILGLTLLVYFFSKKKSAAFRHSLLSLSLMILLILPVLTAFAPSWHSTMFPAFLANPQKNNAIKDIVIAPKPGVLSETASMPAAALTVELNDRSSFLSLLQDAYPYFAAVVWSLGLIFLFSKLAFGLYGTLRITNGGKAVEGGPWQRLFVIFSKKISLKRKIRLLKNDRVIIPMTWGVRKPVIMLPTEAKGWPVDHCSTVLAHELSHIKRGDFLVRLLAAVSCSLYWFNPLSWIVFRQLKKEQEKACDEMVLKAGIKPSIYASCLLYMKKSIEKAKGRYVPAAAIGMAGKSEFKERLTTILKKQFIPKEEKMKTKITLIVLGIFAAALIGTAKPARAPLPSDYEDAVLSRGAAVEQQSTAVTDEKEKKKEEKEKKWVAADKEKKEKANEKKEEKKYLKVVVEEAKGKKGKKSKEKEVNIYISGNDCEGKGEKKFEKVICLPLESGMNRIKVEGDHLVIYEKDKPVKKIKIEGKEGKDVTFTLKDKTLVAFIGEGEEGKDKDVRLVLGGDLEKIDLEKLKKIGKHVVVSEEGDQKVLWVGKDDDDEMVWIGKDGEKTFNIIKTGDKDKDVHIVMKKGKLTTCGEEGVWVVKEGEGDEGERVFKIKTGDKEGDTKVYKIKTKIHEDGELKKNIDDLKKSMASIDKEFKAKSPKQEKVLKEMEEVLKKLEQELEERKGKHKKVDVFVAADDDELLEIDEADREHVVVKKMKEGDFFFTSKGTDFGMEINASEKITKKQISLIKKEVAKLKKKLPKSYKVKSDITGTSQEISIKSGDTGSEKVTDDSVMKEIKKFETELEKIMPGLKGKKSLQKKIWIQKKEEKKK